MRDYLLSQSIPDNPSDYSALALELVTSYGTTINETVSELTELIYGSAYPYVLDFCSKEDITNLYRSIGKEAAVLCSILHSIPDATLPNIYLEIHDTVYTLDKFCFTNLTKE